MSFDAFMYLEGPQGGAAAVNGETTDTTFAAKKAFEIYSFSFGASNPTSIGSGAGGAGGGKVGISSFNLMKKADNGSHRLFNPCCCGGPYDPPTVLLRPAGGTKDATGTI